MNLSDLLNYNDIVIQCHDNPDADALASGFAVYTYLKSNGKNPRFVYRGPHKIQKSNLIIMVKELNIPVSYEPDFNERPELLVLVDCQYGQRNVTATPYKTLAVIDHHQRCTKLPPMSELYSNIGSCSTIVWSMITREGLDVNSSNELATALYYGLFTDTNKLSEMSHPLDRDMVDRLTVNKSIITLMSNSNFSLEEFAITGRAMLNHQYNEERCSMVICAEPCDPNILGVISDFTLETDKVNICIAYYESDIEIKFSVRSCSKEIHANDLAEFIAREVGGGGGHINKAGGTINPDLIDCSAKEYLSYRIDKYFETYHVLYAENTTLDTTKMKRYVKQDVIVGTVKLTDMWKSGTSVEVRTLEGDIDVVIEDDTYLMIGVQGEIYPIREEKLLRSYNKLPFSYVPKYVTKYTDKYDYSSKVRNIKTGEEKLVIPFAKSCKSSVQTTIYAMPLTQGVKLFTAWDKEKYYTGEPGDYIAVRSDDPHDIYIINKDIFPVLYK